jgi:hypothetical protein
MDEDRYQTLAAAYLKALARADMRAYRQHRTAGENAAPEPDAETRKLVGRMKRVRLAGYQRPLERMNR